MYTNRVDTSGNPVGEVDASNISAKTGEMTIKEIEEDYNAFSFFDRHDERVGHLLSRIKELKEGVRKILILPKIKKPLEFTFEKERTVIYFPKELYEELYKLWKEK